MISPNLKRKLLIYMTYQFDGDWNKILDELQNPKIKVSLDDLATLSGKEMCRKYPKFHPMSRRGGTL